MSLASLWVTWKQHQHRIGSVVVGLLLFAAGWQTGRVMSPYYASHPIVFEEAAGEANTNNGSVDELVALQAAGQPGLPAKALPQAAGDSGAVAATTTSASPIPEASQRLFVGSKNSNLYHHKDCPSAKRIKEANQIWWPSTEAAEAHGYRASQCTKEKLSNT
jgi:hypothetical protein